MARIAANGITIEFESTGSGEPVLLVMGLGAQLTDWPQELIDLLVEHGYHVIRFDNRDSGLSTEFDWDPPAPSHALLRGRLHRHVRADYDISDMAADAAGLLDALDLGPAHVVGVSLGGMIAQQMAIDHPSRVRTLTSIMSNTGDGKHGLPSARLLAKLARLPPATPETAVERSVQLYSLISGPHFDPDEHRQRARAGVERSYRPEGLARQTAAILAGPDRTAALAGVTAPTLVIHGLVDPMAQPSGGIATASAVPTSRLVMFPDMGHDLPGPRLNDIVEQIACNAARSVTRPSEPAAVTRSASAGPTSRRSTG